MREIKFRAWDKVQSFMIAMGDLKDIEYVGRSGSRKWEQIEVMQYTGLKDKNGKEIYEGDVIKIPSQWWHRDIPDGEYVKENVKWVSAGFMPFMGTDASIGKDVEVLGNIYENPELLTKI